MKNVDRLLADGDDTLICKLNLYHLVAPKTVLEHHLNAYLILLITYL